MTTDLRERLLTLASVAVVIGLLAVVYAARSRESPYAPIAPFVGCYSNARDRLLLLPSGRVRINGATAGSYKIVKPVGGKHGYLVDAEGLNLKGELGSPITAMPGDGGFLWPISSEAIHVQFAPGTEISLKRTRSVSC